MPIVGLDHVQVAAPRTPDAEAQARAFYGDLLGLAEIEKPDILKPKGGVWFSLGEGQLHIGIEDAFAPARKAHPAFQVRDLRAMRAKLEGAGVSISEAEPISGVARFYVHDPFGNRIELTEVFEVKKIELDDKLEGARLGWQTVDTTYPFASRWLTLRKDRVIVSGKGEIEYTYVESKGAVGVVPVTQDGKMVLIRQYRYTVDEWTFEIPAGGMHDAVGEAPESMARQELLQEIGATCGELIYAGHFYSSIGNSSQAFHVFLALDVAITGEVSHEDTELIEVYVLPLRDALDLVRAGKMKDGVSALSILLCEELLRRYGYI